MAEYIRIDYEDDSAPIVERYQGIAEMVEDATRFYHEHFTMDEDYDENFEVLCYSQALEFWECNGYEIVLGRSLNYKNYKGGFQDV